MVKFSEIQFYFQNYIFHSVENSVRKVKLRYIKQFVNEKPYLVVMVNFHVFHKQNLLGGFCFCFVCV